jgi:hypothetical protein
MVSREASYRPGNRHRAGDTKNGGEKQVPASQRKTKTKAREQRKRNQLPKARRHIHTASDFKSPVA